MHPGPQSYHAQDGATIHVSERRGGLHHDDHGQPLASYELEPCSSPASAKTPTAPSAACVTYDEIPPNLVQAVLAIEDRRFFEHGGVNYCRTR